MSELTKEQLDQIRARAKYVVDDEYGEDRALLFRHIESLNIQLASAETLRDMVGDKYEQLRTALIRDRDNLLDERIELRAALAAKEQQLQEAQVRIKMLEDREQIVHDLGKGYAAPKLENRDLKERITQLERDLEAAKEALRDAQFAIKQAVCKKDTDGDGNCGRTWCPFCRYVVLNREALATLNVEKSGG